MKQQTENMVLQDGTKINCKFRKSSKTLIVAVHGIGEHFSRHAYLEDLNDFSLFQYDLRGHGYSSGKRAYIDNFYRHMEDLKEILQTLKKTTDMSNFILFGHSMGALIVSGFMQKFVEDDNYPSAVIINAPPISFYGPFGLVHKLPKAIFKALSALPFGIYLKGLIDLSVLSHNTQVELDYISDNRSCQKLHTSLLLGMSWAAKDIFSSPLNLKCPGICTVGTDDKIVSVEAIEKYFGEFEPNFTLKFFPDAYHEIHNEISPYGPAYLEFLKDSMNHFSR